MRQPFLSLKLGPLKLAGMIAVTYAGFTLAAMFIASYVVTNMATSKLQMTELELWKGIAFVVSTAGVVFYLSFVFLHWLSEREKELSSHRQALIRSEQRGMAGLLASAVAHNLKNQLCVLIETVEELNRTHMFAEEVQRLHEQVDSIYQMVQELQQIGRERQGEPASVFDFSRVVKESVRMGRLHPKVRACEVTVDTPQQLLCRGYPAWIRQMLFNFLLNAAEAMGGRGSVRVSLREDEDGIWLTVSDTGPGVPHDEVPNLFQPFFTTKEWGTGLGLFSIRAAAEAHGGRVSYRPGPLGGAEFQVWFPPRMREGAALHRPNGFTEPPPTGSHP